MKRRLTSLNWSAAGSTAMRNPFRATISAAALLAASGIGSFEPSVAGQPGSARNRPTGNKVVPGGGKKEAVRRLARIQAKCDHDMQEYPDAEPPYDVCNKCGLRED